MGNSPGEVDRAFAGGTARRADLIQREIPRLAMLVVVAVGAFFMTRAVAISNRQMNRADALEWFTRGQEDLRAGRVVAAVDAFRRATIKDHTNAAYVTALAGALARAGRTNEARTALLALRETHPESADLNLQLARLAAARHDATEALRYYHYALYSPVASEDDRLRRAVRRELIEFLVSERLSSRAVSELLVLAADAAPTADFHVQLARLFLRADDARHALAQYQEAVKLDPRSVEGLVGAAKIAFDRRDYTLARRYLHQVPASAAARVADLRAIVDLVLSSDPLVPRIDGAERGARARRVFAYIWERLDACNAAAALDEDLIQRLSHTGRRLRSRRAPDSDAIDTLVELVGRAARDIPARCPPATAMDRALLLIAERHQGDEAP